MPHHEKLNYLELPSSDLNASRAFFEQVFGWNFTEFGEEYLAFDDQGLEGGFYKSKLCSRSDKGAALAIFYSNNLESTQQKIMQAGGTIHIDTFSFPGGKRFHFLEPSGNEFAVWSDQEND